MIRIRQMTAADIPLGMRLKEQAGWNQTEADWRRFLSLEPDGCFVAEWGSTAVGTTTTCKFGHVAWIAMVLVDSSVRGRGIGKALMNEAVSFLDAAGIRSVRLDATPLGQQLYERLGFAVQFELARFEGVPFGREPVDGVEKASLEGLNRLVEFDTVATATDRHRLVELLLAEQPDSMHFVERGGKIAGYISVRRGCRAVQFGPCIADAMAAPLLLTDACRRHRSEHVYMDVPVDNEPAMKFAASLGLTIQRRLTRMCRGPSVQEDLQRLWTSSGPEKG
jgi:ribosomal protein S18 acetylase RimI-like enzyme